MRYEVPQFIDVKDKIFGPLTFAQFVYVAGGLGLAYVINRFVPGILGILLAIPFLVFGLALAFYKVNNRPFIYTVEAFFNYITRSRLYLWEFRHKKKNAVDPKFHTIGEVPKKPEQVTESLSSSRLQDVASSLDILDQR